MTNDTTAAVAEFLRTEMARHHIPGLSLAVVRQGKPVLLQGYGWANLEWQIPATPTTVYEIASITKLFTATAIMRLVESGRISLGDTLGKHLPHMPEAWHHVTVKQMLMHQSGIKSYTDVPSYWETTRHDLSREEILDLVRALPLSFAPGARSAYENTAYYLLGFLLEQISGQAYADFLRTHFFTPLGMRDTRANDYAAVVPRRAAGYSWRDGQWVNKPYYSTSGTYAAGILLSTVVDLAHWDAAVRRHAILSPQTHALMLTPHPSQAQNERQFDYWHGLGWFLLTHNEHPFAGHNGGIQGFAGSYVHFLQRDLTIILLHNQDNAIPPHEIALAVADFYLPSAPELSSHAPS